MELSHNLCQQTTLLTLNPVALPEEEPWSSALEWSVADWEDLGSIPALHKCGFLSSR